jgi:uncharacterized membrane protein YraQ (UPF0718 family)
MDKNDLKKLLVVTGVFLVFYFLPTDLGRVSAGLNEAVLMMNDYARAHVLLCLVPAFFIAGAISVFVKSDSVIKYLGAGASIVVAYAVGASSGFIIAVCSCTVLPLFAGIYYRGAGIGPATVFLYSGPAINILAISMTARILGAELGVARTVLAISFSIIIGLCMAFIFRNEDKERLEGMMVQESDEKDVNLWRIIVLIGSMIGFLVFANFGDAGTKSGVLYTNRSIKWYLAIFFAITSVLSALLLFNKTLIKDWLLSTTEYTLKVTPLLFIGVLAAGFLLGRPGHEALIPSQWIESLLGGNSFLVNLFAAVAGGMMYFATLTEVPIIQGLMGSGMGNGPALTLLLAGPAVSLPAVLVLSGILKWKKTLTYVGLVIIFSALAGFIFGLIYP